MELVEPPSIRGVHRAINAVAPVRPYALNHQLSKYTSQRLKELPVLRDTVVLRDSELSGSQRKTEELKGQYEREVDTLRRNTSFFRTSLIPKTETSVGCTRT
jgi:hypothetical protein